MATMVDARGFSCPQPVLMTLQAIKATNPSELVVLVDTDTSKENVVRAAQSQGYAVIEVREEGEGYRVRMERN